MRSVGTSVAAAVVGVVLAQMSVDIGGGHTIPTEAGFRTGLLIGCGVALVAAAIAAAIPVEGPRRRRSSPAHPLSRRSDQGIRVESGSRDLALGQEVRSL